MLSLHMPLLTAVIITLNEERNIKRCINSIRDVVDEIVVIDSGSTDQTKQICETAGVRFIYKEWQNYSAARNFGAQQALNDWIVALDADEAFSDELKKSVLEIKKSSAVVFVSVKRLTNYCGHWVRHCGWYPDIKLRFYDRRKAGFVGDIHETISPVPTGSSAIEGDLLHYSYYSIQDHVLQYNKFTTLTAQAAYAKGERSSVLKMVANPTIKFCKSYFLQLGFLDGYYGFIICKMSAHATFLKYCKLYILEKRS